MQITLQPLLTSSYLILGYFSALHEACEHGNVDIVSYLISKGVDLEEKDLPDHYAPLYTAQHYNHEKIVTLLLNAGAVPRQLDASIKKQNNCTLM